ncbi:MAG: histidine triad nucleotide-binding protein [Alkaliphilus sp.]
MEDCIFCKIGKKEIPANIVYEDEKIVAFKDINPEAPVHLLIIPKKHCSSIKDISREDDLILRDIFNVINRLAKELGVHEEGYRIVNNCGDDGGQTVNHVHFHLLAGRQMKWPPG